MTLLAVSVEATQAASLRVSGVAGYLSEWEFSGQVTEKVTEKITEKMSPAAKEFSGTLIWKHVGLCSVNGPQEKAGEIDFQISGLGAASRIDASLWLDGAQCKYGGQLSDSSIGHMDCSNASGVPLTLSLK